MNKEQKAAVVDEVADQIKGADAIFAIDYRGISVKQAMELRRQLSETGARFQIVKNRLTVRAADKAGAEDLKQLLEGPTAFAFVAGDPAVAAKAIATFRRQSGLLEFKGGTMAGEFLTVEQLDAIARLPARDALNAQFVGVLASPLTGLVRGLGSLIGGLAIQLAQIKEQGLVAGGTEEPAAEAEPPDEPEPADGAGADEGDATVDVILTAAGDKKIQVIKVVRAVTGLGLKEAKALVDEAPKPVKEGIDREEAEKLKADIEEAGGGVELK